MGLYFYDEENEPEPRAICRTGERISFFDALVPPDISFTLIDAVTTCFVIPLFAKITGTATALVVDRVEQVTH